MATIESLKRCGIEITRSDFIHPEKMRVSKNIGKSFRTQYTDEEMHQKKVMIKNELGVKIIYGYEKDGEIVIISGIRWLNYITQIWNAADGDDLAECKEFLQEYLAEKGGIPVAILKIPKVNSCKSDLIFSYFSHIRRLIADKGITYVRDVLFAYRHFVKHEWPLYVRINDVNSPYYLHRKRLSKCGVLISRDNLAAKLLGFPYEGQSLLKLHKNVEMLEDIAKNGEKKEKASAKKDLEKLLKQKVNEGKLKIDGLLKKYEKVDDATTTEEKSEEEEDESASTTTKDKGKADGGNDGSGGAEGGGTGSGTDTEKDNDDSDDDVTDSYEEDTDADTNNDSDFEDGSDDSDETDSDDEPEGDGGDAEDETTSDEEKSEFPRLDQFEKLWQCEELSFFVELVIANPEMCSENTDLVSKLDKLVTLAPYLSKEELVFIQSKIGVKV
jgi:hypothetical protein